MGQNSSSEELDDRDVKKFEDSGSDITILQTIVERRGSKVKTLRKKIETEKKKVNIKRETKSKDNSEGISIAQYIKNAKKTEKLKTQKKYLQRVYIDTIREKILFDSKINYSACRYNKCESSINIKNTPSFSIIKEAKTLKNLSESKNPSNISNSLEHRENNQSESSENFHKTNDLEPQIKISHTTEQNLNVLNRKKNNQEVIKKLFDNLNRPQIMNINARLQRRPKLDTLSASHQIGVNISPDIKENIILVDQKNYISEKCDIYNTDKHLEELTRIHLERKKSSQCSIHDEKLNRLKKSCLLHNNLPYQKDRGFRNLLRELKHKIAYEPLLNPSRKTSDQSNVDFVSKSSKNSLSSHGPTSQKTNVYKSFIAGNLANDVRYHDSTKYKDISFNIKSANKIHTFSTSEIIRKQQPQNSDKNKATIQPAPKNDISSCSHHNEEFIFEDDQSLPPVPPPPPSTRQRRFRSTNDNSKIYYYMKSSRGDNMYDFDGSRSKSKKSQRKKEGTSCSRSVREKNISYKTDQKRKVSWIKDENNTWRRVVT